MPHGPSHAPRRGLPVRALLILAACCLACPGDTAEDVHRELNSEDSHFLVRLKSNTEPIPLHELHSWTLHLSRPDGSVVEQATIAIDGGMPDHEHGLPTVPMVTKYLGGGDYLIEGMKFSMTGHWVLHFGIRDGEQSDRVTFNLQL